MGNMPKLPMETAIFGGGCFWCTEAVFGQLKGVLSVTPGYSGGTMENPSYAAICTGKTGHAEVIRVEFDPGQITFNDLLTVFFATHDPTTLNRQGSDAGTQYRSVIFYESEAQKQAAEEFIKKLNDSDPHGKPVVTEVKPQGAFYPAEEYHRDYYKRNPFEPYCELVIEPKMLKLEREFAALLKSHEKKQ